MIFYNYKGECDSVAVGSAQAARILDGVASGDEQEDRSTAWTGDLERVWGWPREGDCSTVISWQIRSARWEAGALS